MDRAQVLDEFPVSSSLCIIEEILHSSRRFVSIINCEPAPFESKMLFGNLCMEAEVLDERLKLTVNSEARSEPAIPVSSLGTRYLRFVQYRMSKTITPLLQKSRYVINAWSSNQGFMVLNAVPYFGCYMT